MEPRYKGSLIGELDWTLIPDVKPWINSYPMAWVALIPAMDMNPVNPVKFDIKTYRVQIHKDKLQDSWSVCAPRLEKLKSEEWKGNNNNNIVNKRNWFLSN